MSDTRWLRGHPALLLPISQLEAYPGEAAGRPPEPKAAYCVAGDGYAGLAVHDPEATTFLALPDGGVLAQLICTDDGEAAPEALLEAFPSDGFEDLGFVYETPDDESVLFEAFCTGGALSDPDELAMLEDMDAAPISISLPVGRYVVSARVGYAPNDATEWTLVRLTRML